jgi:Carboxypeptidase regulatory-like domain
MTNIETGVRSSTTSADDGSFTIPLLPPGQYQLIAKMHGFKRYVQGPSSSVPISAFDRTFIWKSVAAHNR